jgi:hypothetical protein
MVQITPVSDSEPKRPVKKTATPINEKTAPHSFGCLGFLFSVAVLVIGM